MCDNKRYTWTISVIAVYNDNEPPLKEAYIEFENSIKNVKNPNKDIQFVIFFYDSIKKTAVIKKSEIINNEIVLIETVPRLVDIYEDTHEELKTFFSKHVARTDIVDDQEHKHFLITWGHGAGLGFMTTEIEKKINRLFEENGMFARDNTDEMRTGIKKTVRSVSAINTVSTYLSLKKPKDFQNIVKSHVSHSFPFAFFEDKGLNEEVEKEYRSITPHQLANIIREGLKDDKSVVTVCNTQSKPSLHAKIQVMLCLTCYVNMIETVFEFKDLVNVYIAPQTEVPFYGYNYKKLFEMLTANSCANEQQIADNITHHYLAKYLEPFIQRHPDRSGTMLYDIDYKNGVAFSAVYVQCFQRIAENIGLFTKEMDLTMTDEVKLELRNARVRCNSMKLGGIGDIGIIDYENFIVEYLQHSEKNRRDRTRFFHNSYLISDYCPGLSCRSFYLNGRRNFFSLSPGSYSIFLPDLNFSPGENELMKLYREMSAENNSFQKISEWHKIMDIINP